MGVWRCGDEGWGSTGMQGSGDAGCGGVVWELLFEISQRRMSKRMVGGKIP